MHRQGKGVLTWTNGDTYEGEFFNGLRHGVGVYTFGGRRGGRKYEGSWVLSKKEGTGTETWPNTTVYTGEYKAGLFEGFGNLVTPSGEYEG